MSTDWTPDDEELLRQALREEASRVVPDAAALRRIQERAHRVPRWRRSVTWTLAAAMATTATTVAVLTLEFGPDDQPGGQTSLAGDVADSDSEEEVPEDDSGDTDADQDEPLAAAPSADDDPEVPDDLPEADQAQIVTVPAYYLSGTPSGPRLAREFKEMRLNGSVAETALAAMFAQPLDPDYSTPWASAAQATVVETDDAIEVHLVLPKDGTAVPEELGELAVQQLVYTVQAALQRSDPVRVLLDGEPADELWGVDVSDGVTRSPQVDVRQLVQINNPTEGAAKTSPVEVSGEAALFEATYEWRIEQDGEVVEDGSGESEEGQRFAPFSFEVELEPGVYVVIVTATDPSGGEGPGPMSDSRTFTVTGSP